MRAMVGASCIEAMQFTRRQHVILQGGQTAEEAMEH